MTLPLRPEVGLEGDAGVIPLLDFPGIVTGRIPEPAAPPAKVEGATGRTPEDVLELVPVICGGVPWECVGGRKCVGV